MAAPNNLGNSLSSPHRRVCLWCIFFVLPVRNGPLPAELKFRENTLAESKTRSRPAGHLQMWLKQMAALTNMATF